MKTELVKITEIRGRGTRGGRYVYVVEGDELVHISKYAIRTGGLGNIIVYEAPVDKVSGKTIYCFDFSRSGGAFLSKCGIENFNFETGLPKRYEFKPLKDRIHEIRGLRFRTKNPTLTSLVLEFNQLFIPMIQEIKEYERRLNFKCFFMGHQERLADAFEDPELYYFTFMSLPKDESRIRSLRVTRRWIYQLWVLKLLCESLQVSKFLSYAYGERSFWWIEQGSEFPTCVGETPFGVVSFWLEFQPSKLAHMRSLFMSTKERVPTRPDIVVAKGHFRRIRRTEESDVSGPIDILVECKEDPFEMWRGEIDSQILPYLRTFRPNLFLLVSLQGVPDYEKKRLREHRIEVVDNVKPNSESIKLLRELVLKQMMR